MHSYPQLTMQSSKSKPTVALINEHKYRYSYYPVHYQLPMCKCFISSYDKMIHVLHYNFLYLTKNHLNHFSNNYPKVFVYGKVHYNLAEKMVSQSKLPIKVRIFHGIKIVKIVLIIQ